MPILPSWLVPIGLAAAAIAVLCGLALVAWGLWGDRGPRRRRCPRCWHDLSQTPGVICGECGFEGRGESDLRRRRRRWPRAALGLVVLLVGVGSLETLGGTRDLWSYVPGRVLVALLPWSSGPAGPDSVHGELVRRLGRGDLGDRSIDALVAAIVEGDEAATPPSAEWRTKYASLLTAGILRAVEAEPDLASALASLPPLIELSLASPWPEDLPAYGSLDLRHWWISPVQLRLTIDAPSHPELGVVRIGYDSRGREWRRGWPRFPIEFERPWSASPETPVAMRVRVERRSPQEWPTVATDDAATANPVVWGPWVRQPHLDFEQFGLIEAAEPIAERLQAVDGEAMRAAIAASFGPGLVVREEGPRPYAIRFDVSRTFIPELEDTALGLELEVLERGEVRRRTWIWWLAGPQGGPAEWRISEEDAAALAAATDHEPEEGVWTLSVRGDRDLAARAIDAAAAATGRSADVDRYWAGRFEMPLRVRRVPGAFSPRPWFDATSETPTITPPPAEDESTR